MVSPIRVAPTVSPFLLLSDGYTNTGVLEAAARAMNLLRTVQYTHPPSCPCHGNPGHHYHHPPASLSSHTKKSLQRNYATPVDLSRQKEYAFEMAASSIRFGPG